MGEKFDELSKNLASKHSRRGAFRLLGAAIVGAVGAAFTKTASTEAGDRKRQKKSFNASIFVNQGTPQVRKSFNAYIYSYQGPVINGTE